MVGNPVSPAAVALLLTVPGLWMAGRTLARAAVDDLWISRLIAPGCALGVWLLAVHTAGLATGSFEAGLWMGSLATASLGHALAYRFRPTMTVGWVPSRWLWLATVGVILAIMPVAFGWAIHDELFITGHRSITAAIQNGPYPPPNISFPQFDLRYHYGFDLLAAAFTSVFRAPIGVGIDLITLLLWGWTFALLWAGGDRILGRGRGWVVAFTVAFAGGLPVACRFGGVSTAEMLLTACATGGVLVNVPVVAYFFQHPWALGVPLALTMLFVFYASTRTVRYAVAALLLVALSLSQAALFLALAAAMIAAELWDGERLYPRRFTAMLAVSVFAVLTATQLGGFFVEPSIAGTFGLALAGGIANGAGATLAWHVTSFGFVLPLGLLGLYLAPRTHLRTLGLCLVLGSLVLINTVEYTLSWDIVKFGNIAMLTLAAASGVVLARLLDSQRRLAAGLAVSVIAVGGLTFIVALTIDLAGIPELFYHRNPEPLGADDRSAVEWLRGEVGRGEIVYRSRPANLDYARWGGLPQAELDLMVSRLGLPADTLDRRFELVSELPDDPGPYIAERIRWFVLAPGDTALTRRADRWVMNGAAVLRATFGNLTIVELSDPLNAGR